jgi:probable F420-dependent oxidoreductase
MMARVFPNALLAAPMKVGLVMPNAWDDPSRNVADWSAIRNCAQAAEAAGLDSIWVYDHMMYDLGGSRPVGHHEAWTLLTGLAGITTHVELGTLVVATPFRSPALLAKMAATFEEVSGGRLILGLGCGWHEPEFRAFGYPFDHRVARFEEAVQIITELVRTGRCTFEGRWYATEGAEILPPSRRPDGSTTPIHIAGRGPRMLRSVVAYADACNIAWVDTPDQLPSKIGPIQDALRNTGRDPSTLAMSVGTHLVLGKRTEHAHGAAQRAGSGSTPEVAHMLAQYQSLGVQHLIVALTPNSAASIAILGDAVAQAASSF